MLLLYTHDTMIHLGSRAIIKSSQGKYHSAKHTTIYAKIQENKKFNN